MPQARRAGNCRLSIFNASTETTCIELSLEEYTHTMKKLIIFAPLFLVVALMLNSCASEKPAETTTTTTTHETTVAQPSAVESTTTQTRSTGRGY